jgi:hypothetical protein
LFIEITLCPGGKDEVRNYEYFYILMV